MASATAPSPAGSAAAVAASAGRSAPARRLDARSVRSASRPRGGSPRGPRRPQPMLGALLPDAQLDMRLAERGLQLLVLVGECPLALVRLRQAVRGETGLSAFEELPLPGRARLLARLAAPTRLRNRQRATD